MNDKPANSDEDKRIADRRVGEDTEMGTRTGRQRRKKENPEWPYFEKRTHDERRKEENRRSVSDRRKP